MSCWFVFPDWKKEAGTGTPSASPAACTELLSWNPLWENVEGTRRRLILRRWDLAGGEITG
jgi:hypothetical protein